MGRVERLPAHEDFLQAFFAQKLHQARANQNDAFENRIGVKVVFDRVDRSIQVIQNFDESADEVVLGQLETTFLGLHRPRAEFLGVFLEGPVGVHDLGDLSVLFLYLLLKVRRRLGGCGRDSGSRRWSGANRCLRFSRL